MTFVIVLVVVFGTIIAAIVGRGNSFRDNAAQLQIGMNTETVLKIMGNPSSTSAQNNYFKWVYELSEWKGIYRGGVQTRRLELIFDANGILQAIGKNENVDKSGW